MPIRNIVGVGVLAVAVFAALAVSGLAQSPSPAPANPLPGLFAGDAPRVIGYTFPDAAWPNTLPPLCAIARDIPLIAGSGANALYTKGAPSEDGDHIFLSMLASSRLNWIAAYPLPKEVDPNLPLLAQKEAILARFRAFAHRFQGNPNLRAVVLDFGTQHLVESSLMAAEFAEILRQAIPVNTPLLGHVAYDADALFIVPAGVQFWLYRFTGPPPTATDRAILTSRTKLPVLFDLSPVAKEFLAEPAGGRWSDFVGGFVAGPAAPALLALDFLGERQAVTSSTIASDSGPTTTFSLTQHATDTLFTAIRDSDLFENLAPTQFTGQLRALWGAEPLEDHAASPQLGEMLNAATATQYLSPGTRIVIKGSLLSKDGGPLQADDWPLHAGAKCLCVGDRPVPLRSLAASEAEGQLPWLMESGTVSARFVREGVASKALLVDILEISPGVFPRKIERTEAGCSVGDSDGIRPGETIRIEATGTGPLNGDPREIEVLLNETPTEVLYAGLSAKTLGVAELLVEIPESPPGSDRQGLFLRRGNRASNLIPINYVGDARLTVGLVAERERILVQPGGTSTPLRIETRGLNGYCGPIEFSIDGLPKGVSASIAQVQSGQAATLQIRAESFASVTEDVSIYVHALPTPGDLATLVLKLRVMPRVGEIALQIESRGFTASAGALMQWNGELLPPTGTNAPRGLYLLVIDPRTGLFYPVEFYDPWAGKDESTRLEVRLNSLRTGLLVAMAVSDDATLHMQPSLKTWIASKLGSKSIGSLAYQSSWAIVSKVGSTAAIAEQASKDAAVTLNPTLFLPEP